MGAERNDPGSEQPALRCEDALVMLMGYLDGELSGQEVRQIEDHLAVCVDCRSEERAYRRLGEVTEEMIETARPSVDPNAAWAGIYSRLERRVGWLLTGLGLTLLLLFVGWNMVSELLMDSSAPLSVRLGIGALTAGGIVLLVSFVRERLFRDRTERYREIQR